MERMTMINLGPGKPGGYRDTPNAANVPNGSGGARPTLASCDGGDSMKCMITTTVARTCNRSPRGLAIPVVGLHIPVDDYPVAVLK